LCLGFLTCSNNKIESTKETPLIPNKETVATDENFKLLEDFKKNQSLFRADTFNLYEQSAEGGALIAFHSKDKNYLVIDIWLFGETGKLHATYYTDRELNIKIVMKTDYSYDKPYYEKGYKTTESTEYYSFGDNWFKLYNSEKKEINDQNDKKKSILDLLDLFKDVTKDIKIII